MMPAFFAVPSAKQGRARELTIHPVRGARPDRGECDPVERDPESPTHVTNPRIVVEVLSPTTERYDREQKRLYYQQLASLQEYVLVAQDRRKVEVWRRDGSGWAHAAYGPGETVLLPSIDYALDVDALYDAAGVR